MSRPSILGGADQGTIRLGVIPTISPYLLPTVTPHLRKALARLRIAWFEDKTEALLVRLADGRIEGAIVALEADLGDVAREVIATDPFVLVTRPEHPLAAKKSPVSQTELRDEELLLIPSLAVNAEARRARLHVRPLAAPSAYRTIALIWRKRASVEPALHAIASLLREVYPKARLGANQRSKGRR